jgi:hypothetical protein
MSTDQSPPSQEPEPYGPGSYMSIVRGRGHRPPMSKGNRVFLWVFLAIQVIFLGWTIYTGVATPQSGLGLQLGLWAATAVIGGGIYLIYQLPRLGANRPCAAAVGPPMNRQRRRAAARKDQSH